MNLKITPNAFLLEIETSEWIEKDLIEVLFIQNQEKRRKEKHKVNKISL
ncbi:hypothetical protein [Mesomycoplasma hyorhinis]|uniref:Uncharacterized protein n=1 Tax=Mesomycoplasma hyorhinis (strain MCLD) TaxID=936139 RepID=A0ABM5M6W1_MESHM|nr:hypothetical protein [Mesomycoplasma hyorhinis]AEC45934.1 hypothetical protein SRH_01875 [Mesomycoplasma hyorhinis MCLD]QPC29695.1 hypothetical protein ISX88_00265 [Mesomycoplasma hyorhinis]